MFFLGFLLGYPHCRFEQAPVSCRVKQGVQFFGLFKLVKLVAAANMQFADKNLRHRAAPFGAFLHFFAPIGVFAQVDFVKRRLFLLQKAFGGQAIATKWRGINFNGLHMSDPLPGC